MERPAELLLIHGNLRDPAYDEAMPGHTIAIAGGRIRAILPDSLAAPWRGPDTEIIDLEEATVVPGLVDAHGHLSNLGKLLEQIDLRGTGSPAEIAAAVRDRAATARPGDWLLGRGWDQNDWEVARFPDHTVLDAVAPDNPVLLTRVDGHAAWASSAALAAAGIDAATPTPAGGEIIRGDDGHPTGVLIDQAIPLVRDAIPPASEADIERRLKAAMAAAHAVGLTAVHDAGCRRPVLEVMRRLAAEDRLTLRIDAMISAREPALEELLTAGPWREGLLTVGCVKAEADGAMGSRGALLLAPYADRPTHHGLATTSSERLAELTELCVTRGFQLAVHVIGDAATRNMLEIIERTVGARPAEARPRIRLEHVQRIEPADMARLAALGVVASMQPTHATSDMPWVEERLGASRLSGAYAWRSLASAGAPLAFGSDFPVESHRPLLGLYAAITRQDRTGSPPGGWLPEERLTAREALAAFTSGAAFAAQAEEERGRLLPGYRADLTVLAFDPVSAPPTRLLEETAVRMTIVDGRVVWP